MKNALILMTRVPVPDKTKTRLSDTFSPEKCTELHFCFLKDIFRTLDSLKEKLDIYITYTEEKDFYIMKELVPEYIKCFPQEGESLGERMLNAIDKVLSKGHEKAALIGSDVPQLEGEEILKAFEILNLRDLCFGPTFDGGYYLVAMKKPCNEVFSKDITWGGSTVLEATIKHCQDLNLSISLVKTYNDIDVKEDVENFIKSYREGKFKGQNSPEFTAKFLEENWRNSIA
jgi:rSAM/selenodomain-associated transferase 1